MAWLAFAGLLPGLAPGRPALAQPEAVAPPPAVAPAVAVAPRPSVAAAPPAGYRIAPGDELALKFFYAPELNETAVVRPDGRLNLPLVGDVQAADLTPAQLAQQLKSAYAGSVRYPEVAVEVQKGFVHQQVYVGGEVEHPGAQPLTPALTLMRALIVAQGLKPTGAADRVVILRHGAEGKAQAIKVDTTPSQAVAGATVGNDPALAPGDVVLVVPTRVARVNKWIDQYIRQNLPINVGTYYSYSPNNGL